LGFKKSPDFEQVDWDVDWVWIRDVEVVKVWIRDVEVVYVWIRDGDVDVD
jgi:hypothetical protein